MVYSNFYNSTIIFVVFASKKQPKHVGKMPEISKNFKLCAYSFMEALFMMTLFSKIPAKCTNFEVSRLGLELQV